jgi:hypothetical protein
MNSILSLLGSIADLAHAAKELRRQRAEEKARADAEAKAAGRKSNRSKGAA